jgi:ATP-binding cassette subfamily F protein uup
VLLVSHDRDFLDRVATTTVVMDGSGGAVICAGGWSDAQAQKPKTSAPKVKQKSAAPGGLSFTERHRLEALPGEIDRLEAEIGKLEELLADSGLYTREPVKFAKATEALAERQGRLAAAEEEWLDLAERAEA